MAYLVGSSFVGIEHNDARPGSYTKKSVIEQWLKDQAALYEEITNDPVGASMTATAHVHDGTNGAIIPIPLMQSTRRVNLPARQVELWDNGTQYEGFYPYAWAPFFVPAGVSKVMVLLHVGAVSFGSFRVETQDTSLATLSQKRGTDALLASPTPGTARHWLYSPHATGHILGFVCDVNPGAVNVLKLEAWDGYYDETWAFSGTGTLLRDREVFGWAVLPFVSSPITVAPALDPAISDNTRVKVPSSFTAFDAHLVANNRAIPSYLLVNAHKNDALLYEVLTGRPAGNRSSSTFTGHNHKDDAGTSLNDAGADIDHALGAWAYGTLRPVHTPSAQFSAADVPGDGLFDNIWSAYIAPQLNANNALTGTAYTLFYHRVRIPAATSANLADGTGKLKLAALVWDDGPGVEVTAALGNTAGTSQDATNSATATSGGGRQIITISGLECTRPEEVNSLRIQLGWGAQKSASAGIYGTCLYYEA